MAKKKTAKSSHTQQRKHIRFSPDPGALAMIDPQGTKDAFEGKVVGLIVEESYAGVGVVLVNNKDLIVGTKFVIKVGDLDPLEAEVRWRRELDENTCRLGIQYQE